MELQDIFKSLKDYKLLVVVSLVIGVGIGIFYFISPKTYYATGSLYVKRGVDTLKFKYFAYEGYYAQQTALAHTNTIISLLESSDVRFEALNKLNLPTDSTNLRRYSRYITAKKTGPQLITLTVKSKSMDGAKDLWNLVSDITMEKNKQLNSNGDPLLTISKISDSVLVRSTYRPLWLCAVAGAVLTSSLVIFLITIKGYSKWK